MTRNYPVQSQIPASHVTDDIRWLEIHEGNNGFYLFQFTNKDMPAKWDTFYQTSDDVLDDCRNIFGVLDDMWKPK